MTTDIRLPTPATAIAADCAACPAAAGHVEGRIDELLRSNQALQALNEQLSQAQAQLVQSEKMASIGQLAAGVAHEINNPIGYIHSNLGTLERYIADLFRMLSAYEAAEAALQGRPEAARLSALRDELDLAYLKEDMPSLMAETREGAERVRKIVRDLKDFSHVDTRRECAWVDLHRGIESTLNIVNNEVKYRADVVRDFGELPEVHCVPSELNQVFMNLLVNAAQAMDPNRRGTITIRTRAGDRQVTVEIADDGCGIPPDRVGRIFDPFFTTKPVGEGTGLGLSLSYGIVRKHGGRIEARSTLGHGTVFSLTLPIDGAGRSDTGAAETGVGA